MKEGRTILEAKSYGVYSCYNQTPLGEAARKMVSEDISSVVIMDMDGYLTGILTRTDLVRAYLENENWDELPAEEYMSSSVVTVSPKATLMEVATLLQNHHIHRVVVVREDNGKFRAVAVVSDSDLLAQMIK